MYFSVLTLFLLFVLLQMDSSDSELNYEENGEQGTEQNAVEEIVNIMKPYLKEKSAETETNLKEKLNEVGVITLTHLSVLQETDLKELISIADFRLMMRKFRESNDAGNVLITITPSASCYVVF